MPLGQGITLDKPVESWETKKAEFKAIKQTEVASDKITPVELGGHEALDDKFTKKLSEFKDKRRRKRVA